ncbi:nuclear transport factor 2 family protein [Chryseobacterium arachidis]|uniref:nuclear transport factor 2 family protein n=1 Tax=Chryseobacterium arachidis TaxID=1416778 RepID=UPI00361C7C65
MGRSFFEENGILEFPYGPADFPKQVIGKKQSCMSICRTFQKHFFQSVLKNLHFHATESPNVVIAEFTSNGKAISTDKPYNQQYISVVTTNDDGKILKYVDFWNPLVAMEAINAPLSNFVNQ